ncbi:MAG: hypothetical protein HKL81_06585 [Acidimicrobiaceae bacterium]|nr:hypothetical protein [Acidimicrobiaceae bacterium]
MGDLKPIQIALKRIESWLEVRPSSEYESVSEVLKDVVGEQFISGYAIERVTGETVEISVFSVQLLTLFRMKRSQIENRLTQDGTPLKLKLRLKANNAVQG